MKLTFLGAARVVTGSCYLIEVNGEKALVDCGLFQGREEDVALNYEDFKFNPKKISYVFLTHAHEDHSGLIPKLAKYGFQGKIICTPATKSLCEIMLMDSARIQQEEGRIREIPEHAETLKEPLYNELDAKRALAHFKTIEYDTVAKFGNFKIRFREAGHILGAASLELWTKEGKIVFSGDLGPKNNIIVNEKAAINDADYVVMESTYGNKLHPKVADKNKLLMEALKEAHWRGGKLFIPCFAVQRSQELIYRFKQLYEEGKIPEEKFYLDSPLAIAATQIFERHSENYNEALSKERKPFYFKNLIFTKTRGESRKLNDLRGPFVVMAGSGMCTAGRIKHHLRNGIWNEQNTVLFVGFQAEGTLGRKLISGAKKVEMFGETIPVRATIKFLDCFSGHADYTELISWLKKIKKKPKKVFVTHGEDESAEAFAEKLDKLGYETHVPRLYESVEL